MFDLRLNYHIYRYPFLALALALVGARWLDAVGYFDFGDLAMREARWCDDLSVAVRYHRAEDEKKYWFRFNVIGLSFHKHSNAGIQRFQSIDRLIFVNRFGFRPNTNKRRRS